MKHGGGDVTALTSDTCSTVATGGEPSCAAKRMWNASGREWAFCLGQPPRDGQTDER